MSEQDDKNEKSAASDWDAYWRGTAEAASHDIGGVRRQELARFWTELVTRRATDAAPLRLLDVAAGSGAVLDHALEALGEDRLALACVDYSAAAVASLQERYPGARCVQADAGNIPFDDHSFDLVTSQFGVEYAGKDAVTSLGRLAAPGGAVAMLMHHLEGGIYDECRASVDAAERMKHAQFIPLAIDLLRAGFATASGYDPDVYEFAKRNMMPAVVEMKNILRDHGRGVAGGTVQRLYDDVAQINRRVANYDQHEVIGWLQQMQEEMVAYEGRMRSMCDAAIGRADFDAVTESFRAAGFTIDRADALMPDGDWAPLAWALVASRVA